MVSAEIYTEADTHQVSVPCLPRTVCVSAVYILFEQPVNKHTIREKWMKKQTELLKTKEKFFRGK